ncbi:hypothetical protein NC653_026634 [Populus alba x Populus x berolinensis]|uniref:Uncharacterized protein n=1 Tax=Populus alba x Populus x berolinensis TaxID=444605 RepID=A0AAD6MEE0_9ROSI|nr:hypothetical protein NC653_026634 [Populus alba x Populus x berolinensis]
MALQRLKERAEDERMEGWPVIAVRTENQSIDLPEVVTRDACFCHGVYHCQPVSIPMLMIEGWTWKTHSFF